MLDCLYVVCAQNHKYEDIQNHNAHEIKITQQN